MPIRGPSLGCAPIAAEAHIDRPLARTVGSTIFISRWLQAPLYLGLIAAQGVYVWRFMQELWHPVTDLPKGYRDHFSRLAEPEGTVGVAAPDVETAQNALAA